MTIQHTTPVPIPEALRLAAWLTEGAWHKMTLADVEAAGRELRRLHAIVASAPVAPTDENRALDLLAAMFDAYESGVQCYEDPEDQTGYLGHALQLDNDTFHACADLLNRRRPVKSTQAAPVAPAPQPAVPTIMRWHPLAGWGMHPAANGLYVRYEDHAAALAAAPKVDHIADASKMVPAPLQQGEYHDATPGLWFVRKREVDGALQDCFVAAPDCLGLPYSAEILGDDEYRDFGNANDGSGIKRKLADCELIVSAVNAARGAAQAASAVTAQGQYYDAHFASSGHRPYFLPFSARTAIAARHGTHVTKEFNALVADVVFEFMARHLATPAAPAPVAEDADDAARWRLLPLFMQGYDVDWVELLYNLEVTFKRGVRAQAAQPKEASNAG